MEETHGLIPWREIKPLKFIRGLLAAIFSIESYHLGGRYNELYDICLFVCAFQPCLRYNYDRAILLLLGLEFVNSIIYDSGHASQVNVLGAQERCWLKSVI